MITRYKNIEDVTYIIDDINYVAKKGSLFTYDNETKTMTYDECRGAIVLDATYKSELAMSLFFEEYVHNEDLQYEELNLDDTTTKLFRIHLDVNVTEKQAYMLNIRLKEFIDDYLKKL